jgi:hypothetical protein
VSREKLIFSEESLNVEAIQDLGKEVEASEMSLLKLFGFFHFLSKSNPSFYRFMFFISLQSLLGQLSHM